MCTELVPVCALFDTISILVAGTELSSVQSGPRSARSKLSHRIAPLQFDNPPSVPEASTDASPVPIEPADPPDPMEPPEPPPVPIEPPVPVLTPPPPLEPTAPVAPPEPAVAPPGPEESEPAEPVVVVVSVLVLPPWPVVPGAEEPSLLHAAAAARQTRA